MQTKIKQLEVDLANGLGSGATAKTLLDLIVEASKTGPQVLAVEDKKENKLGAIVETLAKEVEELKKEIASLREVKVVETPKAVEAKVETVKEPIKAVEKKK